MTCDAATLIEAAKCYRFPQNRTRAIWVAIVCQWLESLPPPVVTCDALACDLVSAAGVNSIWPATFTGTSVGLTAISLGDTYIADNADLTLVCAPHCTSLVMFIPSAFYIARNPKLTDIIFPVLADATLSNYRIANNNALVTLELPAVTSMGDLGVTACPALTTFSAPLLTGVIGYVAIYTLVALTDLDLSELSYVQETVDITGNTSLTTLDLHSLVDIPGAVYVPRLHCHGCTNLASVNIQSYLPADTSSISFNGCALPVAQIDAILARCVASAAFVSGSVDLAGGTNAAPSSIGPGSDTAILTARGVVVIHN